MVVRIEAYVDGIGKNRWVPLWGTSSDEAMDEEVAQLREDRGWDDEEMVVVYSGNMGLGHVFQDILNLAVVVSDLGIRFAFFGAGKRRAEIEAFAKAHPKAAIELHDYVSARQLPAHLASGDLHLISLRPDWDGTMVPSKLQGIFAAERPVLFTGSETCSLGKWIRESGAGWVTAPGDTDAHLKALVAAYDPEERWLRGRAGKSYGKVHFNREKNAHQVACFLSQTDLPETCEERSPAQGLAVQSSTARAPQGNSNNRVPHV